MKVYIQLMIILIISLVGEAISFGLHLPVPGSIIGLILLFVALQLKWLRVRHVNIVGKFLLTNMTILFLPAAVGIMEKFDVIAPVWLPIILIGCVTLVVNLVLTAVVVNYIKQRYEGDYVKGGRQDGNVVE